MNLPLFTLLKPIELVWIKDHTNIRNCLLQDLTILELQELSTWLRPSEKQLHKSIYPSITALKILLSRVPMIEEWERKADWLK